jgi:hypothetical protein
MFDKNKYEISVLSIISFAVSILGLGLVVVSLEVGAEWILWFAIPFLIASIYLPTIAKRTRLGLGMKWLEFR